MINVITFGTFDLFHFGHLRILQRASRLGDRLIVGVSTDELTKSKKGFAPICPLDERMAIIRELGCVNEVFVEESLELKRDYIRQWNADILVMGDDWKGRFDHFAPLCRVVYLPRTSGVSTTSLVDVIGQSPRFLSQQGLDVAERNEAV